MTVIPVQNESEAAFTRITKDNRKLTYELRVLQQPQRARACGSGAKSSADRRPVDPPPVIELKIFEGDHKTDVTFNHKANFFIFTTLETARHIAQARGQPVSQPPVLTGSPVSGAALLDRPSPAAYFIFPDLSVRHEGKYRLSFNLYEELKDPKDEDMNPAPQNNMYLPMMGQACVQFRMEVKSQPFTVFSAKKFPGLTESTPLSRVVAEQGCRVRIRRDVRMRRRENKSSKDGDDDGFGYSEPTSADPYRQPSIDQPSSGMEPGYYGASAYTTPAYSQSQMPAYHTQVQTRPSSQQQFHPPQAPAVDTSVVPNNTYNQGYSAYHTPQTHTRHPSMASSHDNMPQPYQSAQPAAQSSVVQPYGQVPPAPQVPSTRPSYPQVDQPSAKSAYYNEQLSEARTLGIDNGYQTTPATGYPSDIRSATPNGNSLPPLKSLPVSDVKSDAPAPYGNFPDIYNLDGHTGASLAAGIRAGSKRGYDRTFDAGLGISMTNGSRPSATGRDVPQIETDEGIVDVDALLEMKTLSYRRANGSLQTKKIPSPNGVC